MLKSATQLPAIIESDNTTSIEVISLDQKSSIAFCKICYSGGSCEQLIHPCFCKGNTIFVIFISNKMNAKKCLIFYFDLNKVFIIYKLFIL